MNRPGLSDLVAHSNSISTSSTLHIQDMLPGGTQRYAIFSKDWENTPYGAFPGKNPRHSIHQVTLETA
ncbi:hypothetical protein PUN4_10051 [Paraburkholderia unamae]|nr:hypothetical protein PUN4_10051 [Paraburkholderia unamae]